MFWSLDQFSDHGLDDANVSIQCASEGSPEQGNPEVGSEAHQEKRHHCTEASRDQDRLAADAVGEITPKHPGEGLGERKGRDQDSGVERSVGVIGHMKVLDHRP